MRRSLAGADHQQRTARPLRVRRGGGSHAGGVWTRSRADAVPRSETSASRDSVAEAQCAGSGSLGRDPAAAVRRMTLIMLMLPAQIDDGLSPRRKPEAKTALQQSAGDDATAFQEEPGLGPHEDGADLEHPSCCGQTGGSRRRRGRQREKRARTGTTTCPDPTGITVVGQFESSPIERLRASRAYTKPEAAPATPKRAIGTR